MIHGRSSVHPAGLAHRVEGTGPPLLLLHGWGVTYPIWQNLLPLLRPYFQLIVVELPGHGASPAPAPNTPYYQGCATALEELRRELGIERWSILAYSVGSRAAEIYLQRYRERVDGAVFLCPISIRRWCHGFFIAQVWVDRLSTPVANWILRGRRLSFILWVLGFNGKRHEYLHMWQEEIERQTIDRITPMLYDLPGLGRAPYHVPPARILFVWGENDVISEPPEEPGPSDLVIPGTHCAPLLEAPRVAEVVLKFLAEGQEKAS